LPKGGKNLGKTLPLQSQRLYDAKEVRFRAYPRLEKELQRNSNSTETLTNYLRILVPKVSEPAKSQSTYGDSANWLVKI
jgi:hypothetical protein